MNPLIGRRVEHQGQTLVVGHGGRLYAPRTSVDAWGRTRHTQKITKFRIATCVCGHSFITHDARMKRCADCQARLHQEQRTRHAVETPPLALRCRVCGQPLTAQRRTKTYCTRACQQKAYRERLCRRHTLTPSATVRLALCGEPCEN